MRQELGELRSRLHASADHLGTQNDDITSRVQEMELEMDDVLDKLWELDKSWKNNLVFYGVKSEEGTWWKLRVRIDYLSIASYCKASIPCPSSPRSAT